MWGREEQYGAARRTGVDHASFLSKYHSSRRRFTMVTGGDLFVAFATPSLQALSLEAAVAAKD